MAMPSICRHIDTRLRVDVEDRDLGAGFGQHARGRGAEAGSAAGDDRGMSTNVHAQLTRSVCLALGDDGASHDDVGRRRVGVKLLDQSGAMCQHGALVDRSFVGHLAEIE